MVALLFGIFITKTCIISLDEGNAKIIEPRRAMWLPVPPEDGSAKIEGKWDPRKGWVLVYTTN